MTVIACPLCAGPIEMSEKPTCLIGHEFDPHDLERQLEHEASRALWSAVRSLEDTASGARWRMTLPSPPSSLTETIQRVEEEVKLLRGLLDRREGQSSDTRRRPDAW